MNGPDQNTELLAPRKPQGRLRASGAAGNLARVRTLGAGHHDYVHEALCYGSEEEFLGVVVPFVDEGIQAGEPTVVALGEANAELMRAAMADSPGLWFLPGQYTRPASAIKSYREVMAGYVAAGASRTRLVGEIPPPGIGAPWEWWARYEAVVNHAFAEFPLWGLCVYDTRTTPGYVLDDVLATHPYLATADGGHVVNDRYTDPAAFLTRPRSSIADPLEAAPPMVELLDPTPAAARRAVAAVGHAGRMAAGDVEDLVIAVDETVSNALRHGRPPVRLRLWHGPDRIVVTVTDNGAGPADPFAGLLPAAGAPAGGLGLWLTHQLCNLVTLDRGEHGFTIRLVAGEPNPAT